MPRLPEETVDAFVDRITESMKGLSPSETQSLLTQELGYLQAATQEAEQVSEEAQRKVQDAEARLKALRTARDVLSILDQPMSAGQAIRLRDRIARPLLQSIQAKSPSLPGDPPPGEVLGLMLSEVHSAQIVIWRSDIFAAATKGHEVFQGEPFRRHYQYDTVAPQWWFFTDPLPSSIIGGEYPVFAFYLAFGRPTGKTAFGISFTQLGINGSVIDCATSGFNPFDRPIDAHHSGAVAALRFLDMDFVTAERNFAPREMRRAAEMGRRPPIPEIKTIVLRRAYRDPDAPKGESEREYHHQWMVSGFWRRPSPLYKSQEMVYVRPHLKGPEGAPMLEPRDTIYKAIR